MFAKHYSRQVISRERLLHDTKVQICWNLESESELGATKVCFRVHGLERREDDALFLICGRWATGGRTANSLSRNFEGISGRGAGRPVPLSVISTICIFEAC